MKYFISSSAPLDQQVLNQDTGYTWADQFMEATVTKVRDTYAMYDKALADGYELDEDTLFFFAARGIDPITAENILTREKLNRLAESMGREDMVEKAQKAIEEVL